MATLHLRALHRPLFSAARRNPIHTPTLVRYPYAAFHSTPRRNCPAPLIPFFATILKTSTALELARTVARIGLTIVPLILLKNHKVKQFMIRGTTRHGQPISKERKEQMIRRIRSQTLLLKVLLLVPFVLFWGTIVASLERTPLTGRWRMIILSPEEEDEVSAQLAGPGWYQAINNILAEDEQGALPKYVSPSDWRYLWVSETLRKLEAAIPILAKEPELFPDDDGEDVERKPGASAGVEGGKVKGRNIPKPPPAEYPLKPRPRASEYLKSFCEVLTEQKYVQPGSHTIPGPPYSLVVVDNPEIQNAFSYGFGPDGGGGIVVYSGFLDDIFERMPPVYEHEQKNSKSNSSSSSNQKQSWVSWFFGNLFTPSSSSSSRSRSHSNSIRPIPTTEQTTELAILLAHELSHLILSHHLETLSSTTVIVPGTMSIISDIVRVAVFPITMMFGPFVNDAVAQLGKIGSVELSKVGSWCMSMKQETEADVVSVRLLAHAGYDARDAVKFWENRGAISNCASGGQGLEPDRQAQPVEDQDQVEGQGGQGHSKNQLARSIMGSMGSSTHPLNEVRVQSLKMELMRWEEARVRALKLRDSRRGGLIRSETETERQVQVQD